MSVRRTVTPPHAPRTDACRHLAARVIPEIVTYRPGRAAGRIECPILFCVSDTDTVTPPGRTLTLARRAPRGEIKRYDAGHFEFYTGHVFERLAVEQTDFLVKHLA